MTCLAAIQLPAVIGDVSANLTRHVDALRDAAAHGADLAVFPELSVTGYDTTLPPDLDFTEDDDRLRPLQAAAREHGITAVVGAPLRRGAHRHIAALILTPDGATTVYTKQYLGGDEPRVFDPGTEDPLLPLSDGRRAALAICADSNRPAHAAAAAERGADVYLVGAVTVDDELPPKLAGLESSARNHGMTVVFANAARPSGPLVSGGGSAIWGPDGTRLVSRDDTRPGLVAVGGAEAVSAALSE